MLDIRLKGIYILGESSHISLLCYERNGTKVCTNRVETNEHEFCKAACWCPYFSSAIFNKTRVMTTLPPGSSAAQILIPEMFQKA